MRKLLTPTNLCLLLILILAALLRFYHLADYIRFLGDEGRDVLVVKRIIVDHTWTLLGPTMSVAGFYVGPIYYYFMIPFLWLFNLNPVGPAVMSGLFGLSTVALSYIFGAKFINGKGGLLLAFLVAISPKFVEISRFSWNPNPMPFFSLLILWFLYLAIKKNPRYHFFSGLSFGVLVQLHYLGLIMFPVYVVSLVLGNAKNKINSLIKFVAGAFIPLSFFILYELRHDFQNTRGITQFIFRGGKTIGVRNFQPLWLFDDQARQLFEIVLGFVSPFLTFIYSASLLAFALYCYLNRKRSNKRLSLIILGVWLLVGIYGLGAYTGQLFSHYYAYLFPLPLILIVILCVQLFSRRLTYVFGLIIFIFVAVMQFRHLYFWTPPNKILGQTQTVAADVLRLAENKPYNFALISHGNSDHAYRYFLEIWNHPPITIKNPSADPERKTVTTQLIVVCEEKCGPLGYSLWEVAGFGRAEISTVTEAPVGIKIYKLLHYYGK